MILLFYFTDLISDTLKPENYGISGNQAGNYPSAENPYHTGLDPLNSPSPTFDTTLPIPPPQHSVGAQKVCYVCVCYIVTYLERGYV